LHADKRCIIGLKTKSIAFERILALELRFLGSTLIESAPACALLQHQAKIDSTALPLPSMVA
jgi:hypothetical protein